MISSSQIDFIPLPEMLGHKNSSRRTAFYAVFLVLVTLYVYSKLMPCPKLQMVPREPQQYLYDQESNTTIPYDKNMPLIFIGGMPRSGTTLMRVLLDTHPEVRCGEETRVIPRILGMRTQWERAPTEKRRLREAGITDDVLDAAVTSFILEIIAKHGDAAPRLCNKDPFTLKSSLYLSRLFPQSKYILMVRDGRAVVHSIITRKVTITGFDLKDYRSCMKKWNTAMEVMYAQCIRIGGNRCMPVYYEQLVLHPELWLKRILEFLDLQWDDKLLHHEDYVGKPGGISLSKVEKSTDQVIKPINVEALTKWAEDIPDDVRKDMPFVAPMLSHLGYDPDAYPPNYGQPDTKVADNTLHIQQNKDYWRKREMSIARQKDVKMRSFKEELDEMKKPNAGPVDMLPKHEGS